MALLMFQLTQPFSISPPQLKAEVLKKLQISETELDSFFGLKDNLKSIKLSEPSDRAIVYTNGDEPYFLDATGKQY
jgi:hypothetical protein